MPVVTRSLVSDGAVVELSVGVHEARRAMLQKHTLPVPSRIRVTAQLDTGTPVSAIAPHVLQRLNIQPIDTVPLRTTSPTGEPVGFNVYPLSLALVAPDGEKLLPLVEVIECAFDPTEGIQAILGWDVRKHCLFAYNGPADSFSLGF
jgi:hypothetical protein